MITARSVPMRKEIKKRFMVMRWGDPAVEEPPRGFSYARVETACYFRMTIFRVAENSPAVNLMHRQRTPDLEC